MTGQVINTNVSSLNAQRNLSTSQSALSHVAAAPVLGPAHQQRQGRRRRPRHLRALHHADPRPEPGRAQCQRRHLAGADGRRRPRRGHQQPAAHPRTGRAVGQRHELGLRPRRPRRRKCSSASRKSSASRRRPRSTARRCSTARSARRPSRSARTSARRSRSTSRPACARRRSARPRTTSAAPPTPPPRPSASRAPASTARP